MGTSSSSSSAWRRSLLDKGVPLMFSQLQWVLFGYIMRSCLCFLNVLHFKRYVKLLLYLFTQEHACNSPGQVKFGDRLVLGARRARPPIKTQARLHSAALTS